MEKLKDFIEYWTAVARLTKAQAFALFERAIAFFSGKNEDE